MFGDFIWGEKMMLEKYIEDCKQLLVGAGIKYNIFLAVMIQEIIDREKILTATTLADIPITTLGDGFDNLAGLWKTNGGHFVNITHFSEEEKVWVGTLYTAEGEVAGILNYDKFANSTDGNIALNLKERKRGDEKGWIHL